MMNRPWIIGAVAFAAFAFLTQTISLFSDHPTADDIALEHADAIAGKTFVVTGGSAGIGFATADSLAKAGANVIIASRHRGRGEAAAQRIKNARFEQLDLGSFRSVAAFARRLRDAETKIDGICCNAGYFSPSYGKTADGLERVLQINHLGHMHLVLELNATLAPSSRIVVVSSWWSAKGAFPQDKLMHFGKENYPLMGFQSYGMSKLANVRFARELSRRFEAKAYATHPGMIKTDLGVSRSGGFWATFERRGSKLFWDIIKPITKSLEQGAATQVYALVAPDAANESGSFYDACRKSPHPISDDDADIDRAFWDASMKLIRRGIAGGAEPSENDEQDDRDSWFRINIPVYAFRVVALHLLGYWLLFTAAAAYFVGGQRLHPKYASSGVLRREKWRTMYSACIDGCYCILIEQHGLVYDGFPETFVGLFATIAAIFFWTDFHFYATHRMLHFGPLFRMAHYSHHESRIPGPWSSTSFHPIEGAIFFSAYLLSMVMPTPRLIWIVFKAAMVLGPLHAHCGYDLGIVKGPAHHYLHHRFKNGNFGGFPSGIYDKIAGTELAKDGSSLKPSVFPCRALKAFFALYAIVRMGSIQFGMVPVCIYFAVLWLLLVDGMLVVSPPQPSSRKKVFVVGLSRTGTTSISEALETVGIHCHHFCSKLVRFDASGMPILNPTYADEFQAHSDISAALIFKQLAQKYPDALFIYTERSPKIWAKAMISFLQQGAKSVLFRVHPTAKRFYSAMYGDSWHSLAEKDFEAMYAAHHERVLETFRGPQSHRLLRLNISSEAKTAAGQKKLWQKVVEFTGAHGRLDMNDLPPFPHRFVFRHSLIIQPLRQFQFILARLSSWPAFAALMLIFLLTSGAAVFDYGQCNRSCGAHLFNNGVPDFSMIDSGASPKTPFLLGGFEFCTCSDGSTVPRRYAAENWTEPFTTSQVCGANRVEYASAAAAAEAGVRVMNCNSCGR